MAGDLFGDDAPAGAGAGLEEPENEAEINASRERLKAL